MGKMKDESPKSYHSQGQNLECGAGFPAGKRNTRYDINGISEAHTPILVDENKQMYIPSTSRTVRGQSGKLLT